MRSLEEVRHEVLLALAPGDPELVSLANAAGRVLAQSPVAAIDVPPTDVSAMDGYAIRVADTVAVPTRLSVVGRVAAGQRFPGRLDAGQAVRIFTGAALPEAADAVIMQEDTRVAPEAPGTVDLKGEVKPWEHIRFRGEDVARNQLLLIPGRRLSSTSLALLAAAGVSEVSAYRKPRIGILVTGSELVPPGEPLEPGQIYESNGLMLTSLLQAEGVEVTTFPTVPDDLPTLEKALQNAWNQVDLLVTSGGASVGEPDLVRAVIVALGGEVFDGEVALKPGKPFFWARRAERRLLGLPGNPVSAFVTAVLLVLPAVRQLLGLRHTLPPTTHGTLRESLVNGDTRRHFVRVVTDSTGQVRSAGVQASNRLQSLAAADGLVDVPPRATLVAGTPVAVIRWGEFGKDEVGR